MSRSIVHWLWRAIAGALAVSSVLTFGGLYALGRSERLAAFEASLLDDLRTVANGTQSHPDDDLYVNIEPEVLTPYLSGGTRFFQVWDAEDNELVDQSASLQGLGHLFERPREITTRPGRAEAVLPDGRAVSLIFQRTSAHWGMDQEMQRRTGLVVRDREVLLLVGRARSELTAPLARLAAACVAGALVLPVGAALLLWLLLPRALRPLHELVQAIEGRGGDELLPFAGSGVRELQPIVERLNGLMSRIEDKRRRERRFVVDTAHEMRSPLAELHAVADVALLEPDDPERCRAALADARDTARRLAHVVDTMYGLARHERTARRAAAVVLGDVVQGAVHSTCQAAAAAQTPGLSWQLDGDPKATIVTDPLLLRALLDNLLGNVQVHAPAGASAAVSWRAEPAPCIEIVNACVAPAVGQPAGASADRLGIGLNIAQLYAQALGAELHVRHDASRFEARIAFDLPRGSASEQGLAAAAASP
jgi:signal transduction histidine kinase